MVEPNRLMHQPDPHGEGDFRPGRRPLPLVVTTEASRALDLDREVAAMSRDALLAGIDRLRRDRGAVVLAHNYQIPDIQDLADCVGDSLELSREAARTDASVIAFCGVHFMAETAAILCPDRRVLIPDADAGCSLAASVTVDELRRWRGENPDAVVVAYVNTSAAVKAEADICCTSANAVEVIKSIPAGRDVLFLPDAFLGLFAERMAGRPVRLWLGECHVHAGITTQEVQQLLDRYPDAHLLLHPESGCVNACLSAIAQADREEERTHILGTGGMVRHVETCNTSVHIIGTEVGLLHRLRKLAPTKQFVALKEDAVCEYMKAITLPKLYRCLRDLVYEVTVPDDIAHRARRAVDRMLAV